MIRQATTSQDLTLGAVFNDFYVVPDYQREYVWEKKEVDQLLRDVHQEFTSSAGGSDSEYFMGTLVVCPGANGAYELIDGQQRLTTFFLLFCALQAHIREAAGKPIPELEGKLVYQNGKSAGNNPLRYRVILGYQDSAKLLQTIAGDGAGVDQIIPTTRSIENIQGSYRVMRAFFRKEFAADHAGLTAFYNYLTHRIKVVRIQTGTVALALRLYESVNKRGVRLDALDLLKSLMFVYAARDQYDQLRAKWKSLIDQLYASGAMLEEHQRDRQWRFLLYYLRVYYRQQDMKEEALYDWFLNNEEAVGYKAKPLAFVDGLLKAAYDIGR